LLPFLIILVGAAIQFHALVQDVRFYPDEALFSTFARHAALNGAWLLPGDLDKPPLSIYASALSMHFVAATVQNGVLNFDARLGEFASRLPATLASILMIPIAYALAQRLYHQRAVSAWSTCFVAFSSYSAVYGATAYTDGLMILFAALSVLLAARGKWLWSGVAMALGFACKQQALYLAPLALALGWVMSNRRITTRQMFAYVASILVGMALLFGWDVLRAPSVSMWALAAANNNPARLIGFDEFAPRLSLWLAYLRTLIGTPTIVLAFGALFMVGWRVSKQAGERASRIDVTLLLYIVGYLAFHWLVAFNIYPRYLLPLIFPAGILAGRTVLWLWAWLRVRLGDGEGVVLAGALLLTLTLGARAASETRANFSEDGNNYSGIIELADYLNAQTLGAVVYDHWLGWELGYYMGEWSDKRRVYYPTPEALVANALVLDDPAPRYFVTPTNQVPDPWLDALNAAGFSVERSYLQRGFAVYQLIPPWAAPAEAAQDA
jgi:hypothetical protein